MGNLQANLKNMMSKVTLFSQEMNDSIANNLKNIDKMQLLIKFSIGALALQVPIILLTVWKH